MFVVRFHSYSEMHAPCCGKSVSLVGLNIDISRCRRHVDLRHFPQSSNRHIISSSEYTNNVSIAYAIKFDFNDLFGPFMNSISFAQLTTLKLPNPPRIGIRALFASLVSAKVPQLQTLEVYWTNPINDVCFLGISIMP